MIKFFRHIRQSLINQNDMGNPTSAEASVSKTSSAKATAGKYFKYAIGEILLVVLGILIALQINNWNENRKAKEKERNLFINLKIDFESRLLELREMQNAKSESLKSLNILNNIIANRDELVLDSIIDYHLSRTVNGFKFNEEFKMLEVVFNTGLINDIENEKLKRKLIEWPQELEEMLEEQRMHNNLIDYRLLPFYSKYISVRDIYENFDFRKYNLPKDSKTTLNKNYEGLLADVLFENFIAESEMLLRVSTVDIDTLISSAEEIIRSLNSELD